MTPVPAAALRVDILAKVLLVDACGGEYFSLWAPDDWLPPEGFPRRELLCKPSAGGSTWRVKTKRLRAFLERGR